MILHIVLNESGTHAQVRVAAGDAPVPPGALVLRPAESAYGMRMRRGLPDAAKS